MSKLTLYPIPEEDINNIPPIYDLLDNIVDFLDPEHKLDQDYLRITKRLICDYPNALLYYQPTNNNAISPSVHLYIGTSRYVNPIKWHVQINTLKTFARKDTGSIFGINQYYTFDTINQIYKFLKIINIHNIIKKLSIINFDCTIDSSGYPDKPVFNIKNQIYFKKLINDLNIAYGLAYI